MQLSKLFNDEKAVSPVIGVILMVAITVILAAVIGTFVLGLGDSIGDSAPSASYDWDQSGSGADVTSVTLTHVSGQNIDADRVTGTVGGAAITFGADPEQQLGAAWADNGQISSGDSVDWLDGDDTISGNDELRVIWTASGGGSSSTLTTYTVQ